MSMAYKVFLIRDQKSLIKSLVLPEAPGIEALSCSDWNLPGFFSCGMQERGI